MTRAGLRVGLYTSPHLVRFTERFQIDGREIGPDQAAELMGRVRAVMSEQEPPTFFEAVTAMALDYFAREKVDLVILEAGMGGRLDATNVVTPLLSVITNISMEHREFLGSTLLDLAYEKAGIIKPRVPMLTGATQAKVLQHFQERCRELEAPFYRLGRGFTYRSTTGGLHFSGRDMRLANLKIGLPGRHQGRNAALALAAAEILQPHLPRLTEEVLRQGLENAVWPGRMHLISENPRIILDGAHNPAAIKALAQSLPRDIPYHRLILVLGIMADKDARHILGNILPIADRAIFTRPVYERAMDPQVLCSHAEPWDLPKQVEPTLVQALDAARDMAREDDLIVVCGSLFTVGEALSILDPQNHPPEPHA
jgi:dihydrofolate synthase/folylpolyglutamate synthase